jgi:hypothetical protein
MNDHNRNHVNLATGNTWTSGTCRSDSDEIRILREQLQASSHRFASEYKGPLRLGIYAAETGQIVSDFGRHSQRWINLFKAGEEAVKREFSADAA